MLKLVIITYPVFSDLNIKDERGRLVLIDKLISVKNCNYETPYFSLSVARL